MSGESRLEELTVDDNGDERRYEARIGATVIGVLNYRGEIGRLRIVHTEVDPAFEGKGVASRLVAGALDDIRRRGLSFVPVCPFVRAYLSRHPEQADLVATA